MNVLYHAVAYIAWYVLVGEADAGSEWD